LQWKPNNYGFQAPLPRHKYKPFALIFEPIAASFFYVIYSTTTKLRINLLFFAFAAHYGL
jgi:hypothetical protein